MNEKPVAAVLGVGPGIGQAVSERFAAEGYAVALLSRSMESMQPTLDAISATGTAKAFPTNAADEESLRASFEAITQELGPPEVLIFNVGPGGFAMIGVMDISVERFRASFNQGVVSALITVQQVLPSMLARGKGTIIFTGATASTRGGARFSLLSAPKFALRSFSQSLAREVGPAGVHVAHVIIDGGVGHVRSESLANRLEPEAIAETYWGIHSQRRSAWTYEMDLRPFVEKW